MKKLLTGILATAACLSCAAATAACSSDKSDLKAAADYITGLYNEQQQKVRVDYDVFNKVIIDDVTYTITWSVDVTEGVVVVAGESKTTIDLDETLSEDLAYVLTGVIKAPNGKTQTITFNRVVEAAPVMVTAPIEEAPVDGTAYKLYMYQTTAKKDYYFTGKMSGYFLATSEKYEEAVDVTAEKIPDTETYYLTFTEEDGDKQYLGVKNVYSGGRWHDNIIFASSTTLDAGTAGGFAWAFDATNKVMTCTVEGIKSGDSETTTDTTTETFYMGTTGTYKTFDVNKIADINANGACIGKLVSMVNRDSVGAETKVQQALREISVAPVYVGATTVTLPTMGTTYPDAAITWTVKSGTTATIAENVLTLADTDTAGVVTVTATATVGETSAAADFTFKHVPNERTAIHEAANALTSGQSFGNAVELEGMVYEVVNAYNPDKGSISVMIITDPELEDITNSVIEAYGLAGNGAANLNLGYTVKVKGIITNYNGTVEFTSGCEIVGTPTKPADDLIVDIEASEVSLEETISASGEVTLPTPIYAEDVTFTWAVTGAGAALTGEGETITYTCSATGDQTATVTLSIVCGEATESRTFTVVIKEAIPAGVTITNDDLATIGEKTSYGAYSSTAGWATANAQVLKVNSKINSVAAGVFAAVINGKTTAVGSLTSPTIAGGVSRIKFNYANVFSESNGCKVKIEVKKDSTTVAETTLTNNNMTQNTVYEYTWVLDAEVTGDCTIVITNLSPSQSTSNKDRTAIWNLAVYSAVPQA